MFFDKEMIYSKRYSPAEEELAQIEADTALPVIPPDQKEKSWQEFCRRMNSDPDLEPIPGQEEKAQEFIALAKKFSEDHEIDIDIRQSPYSVEVCLHFYCMAWPNNMTRQFAQLFNLCDNVFVFRSSKTAFTFSTRAPVEHHGGAYILKKGEYHCG